MSYNIRGLDIASEYEAKVMAKNRFGWTPMSDVFKFTTSATPEIGKDLFSLSGRVRTVIVFSFAIIEQTRKQIKTRDSKSVRHAKQKINSLKKTKQNGLK